jgi:hypothetical protein
MMAGCHGIFEGSASSWKFCFARTWRLVLLSDLNLSCVLLSRMCLMWTWLCRLWTWLCRLWTWLSCESKTCLCRLLYALCHMNMLYMQKFLSPVNCMCIDSETGKRHVVHLEATTCRNLNQTRGATAGWHVAARGLATWTNQRVKRGATRARHMDKPECDTWTIQSATRGQTAARTWTNLSATRGQFRARHVDKPQRDTWRCVKEPRHHIHVSTRLATSATSMGRATWHPLPWPISWPFGLVIEEIHLYDEKHVGHGKVPLLWPKWPIGHGRPMWRSFCDQFNLVISWS